MKKLFVFFFAGICFVAFFISIGSVAFAQTIELVSPSAGKEYSACSYFEPPTFEWTVSGLVLRSLELQFSADPAFPRPVKVKARVDVNQFTVKSTIWKKILLLPGALGGTVYWKVVGTAIDKRKTESDPSTIGISGPEAVGSPRVAQATAGSPLTISWGSACNTKFKVWFGTDDAFTKKKSLSVSVPNPMAAGGRLQKATSASLWRSLQKLLGPGNSTLYWYIESWDILNRHSATAVTEFGARKPPVPLQLEPYSYKQYLQWPPAPLETIFTIQKPKGWEVKISGMCTTLAFLIRDPNEPLRQIFYFGSVRPVYLSQSQKNFDQTYCNAAPLYCPSWVDAPVVNPLTVENFFSHWPEIAVMKNAISFMPEFPKLQDLELISVAPQSPMLTLTGAETTLVRGVFTDGDPANPMAAQGQFLATVLADPFGSGTGSGYMVFGATTPVAEFKADIDKLVESLNSFTISDVYFNWCAVQMAQQWGAVAKIGETLREASDIIYDGWVSRTATQDIMAYKYNDTVRSVEKAWDPDTGNVYEFEAGWYDQYHLNPGSYNIPTLEAMPDGRRDLWEGTILDGPTNVFLN